MSCWRSSEGRVERVEGHGLTGLAADHGSRSVRNSWTPLLSLALLLRASMTPTRLRKVQIIHAEWDPV